MFSIKIYSVSSSASIGSNSCQENPHDSFLRCPIYPQGFAKNRECGYVWISLRGMHTHAHTFHHVTVLQVFGFFSCKTGALGKAKTPGRAIFQNCVSWYWFMKRFGSLSVSPMSWNDLWIFHMLFLNIFLGHLACFSVSGSTRHHVPNYVLRVIPTVAYMLRYTLTFHLTFLPGILCGMYSDILSDIFYAILSNMYSNLLYHFIWQYLTYILTYFDILSHIL